MSYVIAAPDMLATAAADVAGIGSSLSEDWTSQYSPCRECSAFGFRRLGPST
jgi:PE family